MRRPPQPESEARETGMPAHGVKKNAALTAHRKANGLIQAAPGEIVSSAQGIKQILDIRVYDNGGKH
jgi:hypothetical protein